MIKLLLVMKKGVVKIAIVVFCSLLFSSCVNVFKLSDLRPKNIEGQANSEKAKELMYEMGVAHHIDLWDNIETYTVTFGDEFYGFLGKKSHPFKEQEMTFSLSYIPNVFNGQMEILSGKEKGRVLGIQSG